MKITKMCYDYHLRGRSLHWRCSQLSSIIKAMLHAYMHSIERTGAQFNRLTKILTKKSWKSYNKNSGNLNNLLELFEGFFVRIFVSLLNWAPDSYGVPSVELWNIWKKWHVHMEVCGPKECRRSKSPHHNVPTAKRRWTHSERLETSHKFGAVPKVGAKDRTGLVETFFKLKSAAWVQIWVLVVFGGP